MKNQFNEECNLFANLFISETKIQHKHIKLSQLKAILIHKFSFGYKNTNI